MPVNKKNTTNYQTRMRRWVTRHPYWTAFLFGWVYFSIVVSWMFAVKTAEIAQGFAITPSSLEMSNVDLSNEFSDMIITQRGYQANSRVISTSDQMLQELVNLAR